MKVKELIEKLKEYDGEDNVRIEYEGEYCGKPIFMVNERSDEDFGKFVLIS